MAGWGKVLAGSGYPALHVHDTSEERRGFFRSPDGGTTWDQIAGQHLPNAYLVDNGKDIEGDETIPGRVYAILGGTTPVYGTDRP